MPPKIRNVFKGSWSDSGSGSNTTLMDCLPSDIATWAKIFWRSYTHAFKWYYITCKPLNERYDPDRNYIDKVYQKFAPLSESILVTRETDAAKVHYNVLVLSDKNLQMFHDKIVFHQLKLHVSDCSDPEYRINVFKYILKEALERTFTKYIDYKCRLPKDFNQEEFSTYPLS